MSKNTQRRFSAKNRAPLSIAITEADREMLKRMCTKFGAPGVPTARMAATCFARGLELVAQEMGVPTLGADELCDLPTDAA